MHPAMSVDSPSQVFPEPAGPAGRAATARPAVAGWIPWAMVFAAACITYGILWDISWHATIGRDTFWTPAHLMIYLGGTLGGCLGGWLTLEASFWRRAELRDRTVGVYGFRAPLGAWVAIWGAAAMLTSAPFDDWWHNAYGLDVKILSPPHAVLALGMYGVVTGALLLVVADRNRDAGAGRPGATALVLLAGGIQLALASILLTEFSFPNLQHTRRFYLASAAFYPAFLCASARLRVIPMAATVTAFLYAGVLASMVWILPLFPGEPKLAPIYNRVTQMVPPAFPLLLFLPAAGIDLWHALLRERRGWGWGGLRWLGSGAFFVAIFLPAQWFFSRFLISPAADNAFFGGGRFFSYAARAGEWRREFWDLDGDPFTAGALPWMFGLALASAAVGHLVGAFLSRVRR